MQTLQNSFQTQEILSVSALTRLTREVLESAFPLFWISGEISNLTRAASGHWYFSLKDAQAQVRCVMFKMRNMYVDFQLQNGDKIEARANVSFYEPRGEFQLNVEFIRKAGLGNLFETFEALKNKLQAEGLFEATRKKSLPRFPSKIGIVTSPDAAALQDVLTSFNRRNPLIQLIIYPTQVQGKTAAAQIAAAVRTADARLEVDTLIICRGGGSIEDLWSFNEETVVRAIAECSLPTICGVGHETDFTIADFAADLRAPTPTAAAELACQDLTVLKQQILQLAQGLSRPMQQRLMQHTMQLDFLAQRLVSPSQQIKNQQVHLSQIKNRLDQTIDYAIEKQHAKLEALAGHLEYLNPRNVLARGYAVIYDTDGKLMTRATQTQPNQAMTIEFLDGKKTARITD